VLSEDAVKVAVVIPTRNEARTLGAVTAAADAGLVVLGANALIVNADGGSDDGTGAAFLATPTRTQKRLITIDGPPGKGRNLLAAWKFCLSLSGS
jgi:glycosyltransferase involved in cell wall biosynthesis